MLKARNKKGFTLAETLIVVAIIAVLAAIAFIGIITHMRSMTKLEYDKYAKEIFIAAQNHLSMAHRQGYPGCTYFGEEDPEEDGVYYLVVSKDSFTNGSVLNLMLPFGSIDNTVRMGGQYIIRYHKDSGTVLDVFYCESGGRYPLTNLSSYYIDLKSNRDNNERLKDYVDNSVVGWYGGAEERDSLTHGEDLTEPAIEVVNAETLYVRVLDSNTPAQGYSLTLIIEGRNGQVSVPLYGGSYPYMQSSITGEYLILLDDITSDRRFSEINRTYFESVLTPGENLKFRVVASNKEKLSNVAYSKTVTTNSLYGDPSTDSEAVVSNIRHLQNLDRSVLKADSSITSAEQNANLSWTDFQARIENDPWYLATPVHFRPVSPKQDLKYDGGNNFISDVTVSETGAAGVFGTLTGGKVENLKLKDCTVSGRSAGTLAGSTNGTTVSNVLAYNTGSDRDATVSGTENAGGLIGNVIGGRIQNSAAALVVSCNGSAGGLIGAAGSGATVTGCYSGGHTDRGDYYTHEAGKRADPIYNVTGVTAGGLIGSAGNAGIEYSYSTCSVSGTTAGGFVGTADGSMTNCYATGLVAGTTRGAFAGSYTGTASNCSYYSIVNESPKDGDPTKGFAYLGPVNSGEYAGITPFDISTAAFNTFVGSAIGDAIPYDKDFLGGRYQGKYPLRSYTGSVAHYGDWPAPETWVINR